MAKITSINRYSERLTNEKVLERAIKRAKDIHRQIAELNDMAIWNVENDSHAPLLDDQIAAKKKDSAEAMVSITQIEGDL